MKWVGALLASGGEVVATRLLLTATIAALLCFVASPAHAAFPGTNGKLAYDSAADGDFEIHVVNRDGSGNTQLTSNTIEDKHPAWSPDGSKIAFARGSSDDTEIWVMSASGAGAVKISEGTGFAVDPAWSPDGTTIVFSRGGCPCGLTHTYELWTVRSDGTDEIRILEAAAVDQYARAPRWSPDGGKIAFSYLPGGFDPTPWIATIEPDGTDLTSVEGAPNCEDYQPDWSPDGSRIVFTAANHLATVNRDGTGRSAPCGGTVAGESPVWSPDGSKIAFIHRGNPWEVRVVNQDFTGEQTVTQTDPFSFPEGLDWQPVPFTGYARPRSAGPLRVSLVPAFAECTAPNREHGPPLAYGSCNPPSQRTPRVTVGTPDANGAAARSVGWFRLRVIAGVPGPPDDSDVLLASSFTDVRCTAEPIPACGPSQQGGADYAGLLSARLGLRITDKWNGTTTCDPEEGGTCTGSEPATVTDLTFPVEMLCAETSSTSVGSTCSISTSANALVAGSVRDGRRTIWQLDQITVDDQGGPSDPPARFAVQGLFIP